MSGLAGLKKEIRANQDPKRVEISQWFFKTGKGQYGEGDFFLGLDTKTQRSLAKKYRDISLAEVRQLLYSKFHEERQIGAFILVEKFERGDDKVKKQVYDFYLKNTKRFNNWDLVDMSSYKIVGEYLVDRDKSALYKLAASENLWEKRIAIISTYAFIRQDRFDDTFRIAEILLSDKHDLIHKAVGWMLREVGNRDQGREEGFLKKHIGDIPRTALRYAIEKFGRKKRIFYLKLK